MSYRNKTYICFDADTDIRDYNMMKAWKENGRSAFNFHNAHDLNTLRGFSNEQTIKRALRERLASTKVLVVLVGKSTRHLFKFVRWEIEYALDEGIPIICANLNKKNRIDNSLCPPLLQGKLAVHLPYGQNTINRALNDWPSSHGALKAQEESGAHYYKDYD